MSLHFNKYGYELRTPVNLEIYICIQNFNTSVLIITCITYTGSKQI